MAGNIQQLEQFVANIHSITGAEGSDSEISVAKALYELVTNHSDILEKNSQHLDNVLESLDSHLHSVVILAILLVKQSTASVEFEQLFHIADDFITTANPIHLQASPDLVYELCHSIAQSLVGSKEPIRGIDLLTRCIRKTQTHENELLSIHTDLVQLCLLSSCFKPSYQFLDIDIVEISKENGTYDVKNFLLYYYYGGMIYAAVKNFDRAHFFFEQAITCPAMAVSQIMVDAYKKWTLVSLIANGKLNPLPKYATITLNRLIKPLVAPYITLANLYTKNDLGEYQIAINTHRTIFENDRNMGLVKQCTSSLTKRNVQRLTKTFITLSLSDVVNRTSLPNLAVAERLLVQMIENNEIFAEINEKDGMMVRFLDNPEEYNNSAVLRKTETEIGALMALDQRIRSVNRDMTTNTKYIQRSRELD